MRSSSYFILLLALLSALVVASVGAAEAAAGDASSIIGGSHATGEVVALTDSNFDVVVQPTTGATGDWFVEFYAPWCGHCKTLAPVWQQLAQSVAAQSDSFERPLHIGALDATIHLASGKRFDVRGFPTLKLFSGGRTYEYRGPRTVEALLEFARGGFATVESSGIPDVPSQTTMAIEWFLTISNDLHTILLRKPIAGVTFFLVGLTFGLIASALTFALCIEKRPKEFVQYTDARTGQLVTVPPNASSQLAVHRNEYDQVIGPPVLNWTPRPLPGNVTLEGRHCRLEPLDADRHAQELFAAYQTATDHRSWTYTFVGPFASFDEYYRYAETVARGTDAKHYAVIDRASNKAVGTLALHRCDPKHGTIEVGCVVFSPLLQRTRASTEAQFLLMRYAFATLGYRRYEWKCDALNTPSRATAARLGFTFEGVFRKAAVYKNRSRDTAWFALVDDEWPALERAFAAWLADANFDADGRQRQTLATLIERERARLTHVSPAVHPSTSPLTKRTNTKQA